MVTEQREVISADLIQIDRRREIVEAAIAEAEGRAELMARITEAAVKRTYAQDWVDFGGTPYLSAAGAERLRALFGISITGIDTKRYEERDKEGIYYYFVVTGIAHFRGDEFAVMGTCSARDQFFRAAYQDGKKMLLPTEEIDPTNIVKSAYSNMVARGVTQIIGLRDLTWEQLAPLGVERGKGGTATFRDRKPRAEAPAKPAAAPKVDQLDTLRARLEAIAPGDPAGQKALLLSVTAYEAGKKDGKSYKAFAGWQSVDQMVKHGRNPERTAAVALNKILEMIAHGEIAEPKASEPREGDHPGMEGARQPLASTSIADEHAQPPEDLPDD